MAWAQKPSVDAKQQLSAPISSRDASKAAMPSVRGNDTGGSSSTDPVAGTSPPNQSTPPTTQTSPPSDQMPPSSGEDIPLPTQPPPPPTKPPSEQKPAPPPTSTQDPPPSEQYYPQPNSGQRYYYEYDPAPQQGSEPISGMSYRYEPTAVTTTPAPTSELAPPSGGDSKAQTTPQAVPAPEQVGSSTTPVETSSLGGAGEPVALPEQSKSPTGDALPTVSQLVSTTLQEESGSARALAAILAPSPFAAGQKAPAASGRSFTGGWNPVSNLQAHLRSGIHDTFQSTASIFTKNLMHWFSSSKLLSSSQEATTRPSSSSEEPQNPAPQQQPTHDPIAPIGGGSSFSSLLGGGQADAGGVSSSPILAGILASGLLLLYRSGKLFKTDCAVRKMSSVLLTPLERPG
jgi:hypothetical protein